jgi:hypothetical protein
MSLVLFLEVRAMSWIQGWRDMLTGAKLKKRSKLLLTRYGSPLLDIVRK